MTSIWSDPRYHQGHMPSRSDSHGPGQEQIATRPDLDNLIQDCPCSWCSRNGYNPLTVGGTMEYQEPYWNQSLSGDHPTTFAATMDGQTQTSVAPQAPHQENVGYVPVSEVVDPLRVQTGAEPDQVQVLDIPVSERLRRLAGRYVNNPESLVNGVHLESGPSGRFQVVITVEIGDILGDTINSE
ncbi:hypothetical protein BGY98DRAFT_1177967 [Russula aff. rugulosa BPL654]|nr:hypothetical protein BGY98DRAFT_1177967 [Russula aff. rugulosa BPL654]